LKLAGEFPPLRELSFHHCAPQKVTELPITTFWSPTTKLPPPGANEIGREIARSTRKLKPEKSFRGVVVR